MAATALGSSSRPSSVIFFSLLLLILSLLRLPFAVAFAVRVRSSSTSTTAMSSATCGSVATTLGPSALRELVREAAKKQSLDVGGIAWLEHLNLVVGDMDLAIKFYVDFLGFSRDENPKHFNLGQQQFHLAANDEPPQRVTGSIGLTVPSLQRIRERIGGVQHDLEGTSFSIVEDGKGNTMTITCPWGNIIHLYDISIDDDRPSTYSTSESSQKMVQMHGEGAAYGSHRMAVRGKPGIRFVEVACRMGTIDSIAEFYEQMLGCHVIRTQKSLSTNDASTDVEVATVCVGPGVHMTFVENQQLSDDAIKRMEGVHACFYISNFKQTYDTLKEKKLIWTNPRFTYLDSCDTWEEAHASRTLRFRDVVDITTGEKVLELEHETRPMMHGQYMKVPRYAEN